MNNLPGVTRWPHRLRPHCEVFEGARRELAALEREYQPDPDYMTRHPKLNPRMRAILMCAPPPAFSARRSANHAHAPHRSDWLFEVGQEYQLKRETLHSAVNFVDRCRLLAARCTGELTRACARVARPLVVVRRRFAQERFAVGGRGVALGGQQD
jgi:hypothetical protein